MKRHLILLLSVVALCANAASPKVYNLKDYGVTPTTANLANAINDALSRIRQEANGQPAVVRLAKGTYRLSPESAPNRIYYISNHDQVVSHPTGVALEGWDGLTFDGAGSKLLCTGRMLPMSIVGCTDVTVKNLTIDFDNPHIGQVTVVSNDDNGISFEPSSEVKWRLKDGNRFVGYGDGWEIGFMMGVSFEPDTHHMVPQSSGVGIDFKDCTVKDGVITAPHWNQKNLKPGTCVALRGYQRPHPAVFMEADTRATLNNVTVHYAEGMGVVAQMCTDIHLDGFNVRPEKGGTRYFSSNADATHFVQCRGKILVENSEYEAMMDDAINVHGVYLRVRERINDRTLRCRFEHHQAYGYKWGNPGDTVMFVRSATMDQLPFVGVIRSIDTAGGPIAGTKEYIISLDRDIPKEIDATQGYGIENMTWTPEVTFRNCIVRYNNARGALFSSPRTTICENNFFDHTSGTAILLCGDCNGWYESGAVRHLVIRGNRFLNALTNLFQFTNGVISIYPEIPNIKEAETYFHGGSDEAIVIENNEFVTFGAPLIYAKSVDGLVVRGNTLTYNNDFEQFHPIKKLVTIEHCGRTSIQDFPEKQ